MRKIGTSYDIIENANSLTTGLVNENEYNVIVNNVNAVPERDNSQVSINLKKYDIELASPFQCFIGQKLIFMYVTKNDPILLQGDDYIKAETDMSYNPVVTVVSISDDYNITVQSDITLYANQNVILHSNFSYNNEVAINKNYPTNIYVTNPTDTTVDVKFDNVLNAVSYTIMYRKISDGNTDFINNEFFTNNYTLTNLQKIHQVVSTARTQYELKIKSNFKDGSSIYSPEQRFTL